jgi:hypothetical protein
MAAAHKEPVSTGGLRKRMRTETGGYCRDHLRARARRVEVDAKEVRIMGSKSELLPTLVAASSAKAAGFGVSSFAPKRQPRHKSNARPVPDQGACALQPSHFVQIRPSPGVAVPGLIG